MKNLKIGDIIRNEKSATPERIDNGNTIAVIIGTYADKNGNEVFENCYVTDAEGNNDNEDFETYLNYGGDLEETRDGFDYYDDDNTLKNHAEFIVNYFNEN